MLIDSPRLLNVDKTRWAELARYDEAIGSRFPARLIEQALDDIRQWWQTGPGIASVSWGKDSVCMAHLVSLTGLPIPLVWVRSDPFEMPECLQVRDAFLNSHPSMKYEERSIPLRNPKRGEPGYIERHLDPTCHGQDVLKEACPHERYISGVRAQESRIRTISINHRGNVTKNTCRPLARWTAPQIFAYLDREHLPIHPAYAMSYGGHLDRQWLRVHPLCSYADTKTDMARWEDDYYGDYIKDALELRRQWRANKDPRGGNF